MVKRLFAGTVGINFGYFEKFLHFGPKLPYIKSGFSKNQSGYEKLEFKKNFPALLTLTVVIRKCE